MNSHKTHFSGAVYEVNKENMNNLISQLDSCLEENKRLKNQRDWLMAILLGTTIALTFVIHVITMDMPNK